MNITGHLNIKSLDSYTEGHSDNDRRKIPSVLLNLGQDNTSSSTFNALIINSQSASVPTTVTPNNNITCTLHYMYVKNNSFLIVTHSEHFERSVVWHEHSPDRKHFWWQHYLQLYQKVVKHSTYIYLSISMTTFHTFTLLHWAPFRHWIHCWFYIWIRSYTIFFPI